MALESMFFPRFVTYDAFEGLGNRLRSHLWAHAYALHTHRRLVVDWPRRHACWATFGELFDDAGLIELQRWPEPVQRAARAVCHRWGVRCNTPFPDGVSTVYEFDRVTSPLLRFGEAFRPHGLDGGGAALGEYGDIVRSKLNPREPIRLRIAEVRSRFEPFTIGVHIRRGDFVIDRRETMIPLENYAQLCRAVVVERPDALFFFTTDNPPLIGDMSADFRSLSVNRAAYRSVMGCTSEGVSYDYGDRCRLEGIQDAVVDLWTLANAKCIIGSPGSSFTELAGFLGKVPILYPNDTITAADVLKAATSSVAVR